MAPFRVEKISDILKEGEIVPIKVLKVDEKGKISLSIKEADKDFFNGRIK
jgi:polyribonucleotide nucleotidyltransferase